ncbi:MAG TPA: amino acid adenylation domain-containing protein, partial [Longimicrobiaceae bacterium]
TVRLEAGDDGSRWSGLPIGVPLPNAEAHVLDGRGEPVPAGVPGELYLGGEVLARGYRGHPALTAGRWVPHPFTETPGARLCRTGDRVRRLPDGNLEFLGRVDHQVKIRGFRIEPGEIEAVLGAHPAVREAAVVVREDARGEKALVGYVSAGSGEEVAAEALRAWLRERLPEHMVPGAYVALERLPLTPSGKLDRSALPAPEWAGGAEYAAPRTATEEVLAGIWAEILGADRVGVEASFFELGGHSLLAMQVVSRVRRSLGAELPLRVLFEEPTVAALARRVDALRRAGAALAPPIERVPREGALPASFAQQRLWFMDRLDPGSAAYNMPFALRLRGALDVAALRAGLDALVERHEPLRTTLAERDGEPVQVVGPASRAALPVVELGRLGAEAREREAERLAGAEAMRPFDLAAGPLLRTVLLRTGAEDHVVCLTLHHVVSDGWSMGVLVRELSAAYAAFGRGEEPRLPELPVQYADYAVWQRGWLSGAALEAQAGWWRERLAGAPPLLEVPTDRPRAAGQGVLAATHELTLPAATSRGLRALARREGATLFMTMLAGWQTLLARYAGQDDVVVGTPVAGRTRSELEGLIGFFVNMLALRADLSGEPTFADLLRRVREAALGAYAHQDLPFERLVAELATERGLTHAPVFQAVFSLDRAEGAGEEGLSLPGVRAEPFGAGEAAAKFDLKLAVVERGEGLHAALVYRAALFDAATAARMAEHLEVLLEAVAGDPGRRVGEVPLMREAERAQVLEAWNDTSAPFAEGLCLHEAFAAQAARTPRALAVVAGGRALTYAELDARANALAHRLRARGVGPEVRVGLFAERSAETLVGIWGILKAGGALVPLEPEHPADRIRYLLEDAGVRVVLARGHLAAALPPVVDAVVLDGEPETAGAAPASGAVPENAAYVLYTSGSTGRPRGVVVEHRSVMNLHAALDRAVYGGRRARVSVNGPFTFDTSVKQWVQLLGGSTLHVVPDEARYDAEALGSWLRETGVEVLDCTPAQLRVLLAEGLLERLGPTPTEVLVGGEAVDDALWAELSARTERRFHNLYGPTECTVDASLCPVDGRERPGIGRPLANVRTYVLDARLQPVPIGVPGELYVGGAGVARGYLGRPGLTAERFVPDPFGGEPGARLYRTGDRARWTGEGSLEYFGRVDLQVKLRGYRIEPGEVEAVLRDAAGVADAVVRVRDGRLAAYVVAPDGAAPTPAELRAHAASRLP